MRWLSASLRAIRLGAISSPMRISRSNPSLTRSTNRSDVKPQLSCGYSRASADSAGATKRRPKPKLLTTRSMPCGAGAPRTLVHHLIDVVENALRPFVDAFAVLGDRHPPRGAVQQHTSSAFSSNAIRLLIKAGDTPSSSAAAANPARRATSTNTRRSLRIGILFMIRVYVSPFSRLINS